MTLIDLEARGVPCKIKGGKHNKVYEVTNFNKSCLLLKTSKTEVHPLYRYVDTYLPTIFLPEYELYEEEVCQE